MGFRFRKRISILKGLWLNLSGSGVSASAHVPGLTVNASKRGLKPTLSLPGTGVSWTPSRKKRRRSRRITW